MHPGALLTVIALAGCAGARVEPHPPIPALPAVDREFRGVWVATVGNIDWPSRPGLPAGQQRRELVAILDSAVVIGLNAIVLQVRPNADALYSSELEPWSRHVTGEWGKAPEPLWDPLAFAVEEAHRRGLQLHAWFNPFRTHDPAASSWAADFGKRHAEAVVRYGNGWWMDPGVPVAFDRSVAVFRDVVRRYDVDGIHIDDYFYPYPVNDSSGKPVPFPDGSSYARYRAGGGTLARDDWRRDNIERFVEAMYRVAREEKPRVQVGISPFGIWRPGHPPEVRGFDAYDRIYADSRKWLEKGWVDYFTPQLYWRIDAPEQPFESLLRWWRSVNPHGRHIWPGLYTGRVGSRGQDPRTSWEPDMIVRQIEIDRGQSTWPGHVHFSWRVFTRNPKGIADTLRIRSYARPAIVPPTPWLGQSRAEAPEVRLRRRGGRAELTIAPGSAEPRQWVVRTQTSGAWSVRVLPGGARTLDLPGAPPEIVAVSAVDALGNEGWVRVLWPR